MKKIFLVLFFYLSQAQSSTHENNVFSCSEYHGSLVHSVIELEDSYLANISFPIITLRPNMNSNGEITGESKLRVALPLENENIFSTGLNWLTEKNIFFREVFPDIPMTEFIPIEYGRVSINFPKENCLLVENTEAKLSFIDCYKKNISINGVELHSVVLNMQNQVRTTLVNSESDPNALVPKEISSVYANLTLFHATGNQIKGYRSSYTYFPNGDSSQCYLRQQSL